MKFLMGSSALGSLQIVSLQMLGILEICKSHSCLLSVLLIPGLPFKGTGMVGNPAPYSARVHFPGVNLLAHLWFRRGEMEELSPCSLGKSKAFPVLWVVGWESGGSWGPCGVGTSQGVARGGW